MLGKAGTTTIDFWEYLAVLVYVVILAIFFSREKSKNIKRYPEFKYYLSAFYARVAGGVVFTLIYMYYYNGMGDTIGFFRSSIPLANLLLSNPAKYFQAIFADNNWDNYYSLFSQETGYPVGYVYIDTRTYILSKLISPLVVLSFKSILVTSVLVSAVCYGGVWQLFRMMVRYFPRIEGRLAFSVLFFPSVVFWGSGILKDTFTYTAMCWFIVAMDGIFILKNRRAENWFYAIVASYIMIAMKPYIFMTIFPATLLWVLYHRTQRIKNSFVRITILPVSLVLLFMVSVTVLNKLESSLGKFSLDNALNTVVITQSDMTRSEQYGDNYFDLGKIEPTWNSVLSKFPQATFAGLFRPSLLDVKNVLMLIAGFENAFILALTLYVLMRSKVVFLLSMVLKNPLLQMCFLFSIGYAFMIAVTTPNFGAMARFKIPLLPLFVSGLFIANHILDRRRSAQAHGLKFRFEDFANGDPEVLMPSKGRSRA